jgi:bacterioferritin
MDMNLLTAMATSDFMANKVNQIPSPQKSGYSGSPFILTQEIIMVNSEIDKDAVITVLNKILEAELAGVVCYTHYALMVFGYNRIPIVSWLRSQATESLAHANEAGEMITHLGGHPSLSIGVLLETHRHDIGDILRESLEHETQALAEYHRLLELVSNRNVLLEEYARRMCALEETHLGDVRKMLRKPDE